MDKSALIVNIYQFWNIQYITKNTNIADCLKKTHLDTNDENKLFDGTIDVVVDDPCLTE